jgi:hypothetical protein
MYLDDKSLVYILGNEKPGDMASVIVHVSVSQLHKFANIRIRTLKTCRRGYFEKTKYFYRKIVDYTSLQKQL